MFDPDRPPGFLPVPVPAAAPLRARSTDNDCHLRTWLMHSGFPYFSRNAGAVLSSGEFLFSPWTDAIPCHYRSPLGRYNRPHDP